MSLTNYAEDQVLKWAFTTGSVTRPTDWYVGLFTAAPGETGGGTEVSGNGYGRKAATFSVSGTAPTTATNTGAIEFDAATGSWGTITHVAIFDAVTSGNMIAYAALSTSKVVGENDIFRIQTSNLSITLD
jgi:hypothetical protein